LLVTAFMGVGRGGKGGGKCEKKLKNVKELNWDNAGRGVVT